MRVPGLITCQNEQVRDRQVYYDGYSEATNVVYCLPLNSIDDNYLVGSVASIPGISPLFVWDL